jgi:hypothetical protein
MRERRKGSSTLPLLIDHYNQSNKTGRGAGVFDSVLRGRGRRRGKEEGGGEGGRRKGEGVSDLEGDGLHFRCKRDPRV